MFVRSALVVGFAVVSFAGVSTFAADGGGASAPVVAAADEGADLPPCPFICPNDPRFGYDTKQICDKRSGCSVECVLSCE